MIHYELLANKRNEAEKRVQNCDTWCVDAQLMVGHGSRARPAFGEIEKCNLKAPPSSIKTVQFTGDLSNAHRFSTSPLLTTDAPTKIPPSPNSSQNQIIDLPNPPVCSARRR